MDFKLILEGIAVLGAMGAIFGALLAFAAKIFYVDQGYGIALFDKELPIPPWANVKLVPMEDVLPRNQMRYNREPDIHVGWFHDTTNPTVQLFIDTVTELLSENTEK